jgi:hypothetical protein
MTVSPRLAAAAFLTLLPISSPLAPGATISLNFSTAATEPDLAGVVVRDTLIPFTITDSLGRAMCKGQLQDRVVRSNTTGLLHFYYRIRGARGGHTINAVATVNFGADTLNVAYRQDGLGAVHPVAALRNPAGNRVEFRFKEPGLRCDRESRFFFIKTKAKNFGPDGQTRLTLITGQTVALQTAQPAP